MSAHLGVEDDLRATCKVVRDLVKPYSRTEAIQLTIILASSPYTPEAEVS